MKGLFKPHLEKINRVRTSLGRNCENGLILDRNERVTHFPSKMIEDLYSQFPASLLHTYPETASLYQKLSNCIELEENQIFLTFGSTGGIKVLYETLTNPGDKVFVLSPTFPMYEVYSKIFQTKFKEIAIENFKINVDRLLEEIDEKAALVCIANPNLPVETLLTLNQIEKIAEKCQMYNVALVIDEAYNLFGAESAINLIQKYDYLVILRTFSKAYGLAGIRLGYLVSQSQNIDYLSKTRSLVETNGLSMAVAHYMLEHPEIAQNYVKSVREGAQYLQKVFTKLGVNWHGGYYSNGILVFLKSPKHVESLISDLKGKNIYIRGSFAIPYDCCFRVTIGPKDIMEIFFDSFLHWMKKAA